VTPKRILYLSPVGEKGGAESVLLDIIRHLDRTRFEPIVVCLKPGPLIDDLKQLNVKTFALRAHKTRSLHRVAVAIMRLRTIIHREHVDLVHGNGCTMLFYAGLAAKGIQCPVVWHVYDPLKGSGAFENAFVAAQRRLKPEWTIFGTTAVVESYLHSYHNLKRHSTILPAVDVEEVRRDANPHRARQNFHIPENAPMIAMFSRLQRGKGHLVLVEAAKQVLLHHPDTRFVICGGTLFGLEEEYPHELRRAIDTQGLTDSFILTGFVSECQKKDILAATDILVHPAFSEPFGLAVVEGMAAGKPVVATDCAGPSITVQHGKTGLIVPRGDSAALADALNSLLSDPHRAAAMGLAGRVRADENYGIYPMISQIQAVYDNVLGAPV
jgi:glycosyltransferase involved in cell wall biosynthesis